MLDWRGCGRLSARRRRIGSCRTNFRNRRLCPGYGHTGWLFSYRRRLFLCLCRFAGGPGGTINRSMGRGGFWTDHRLLTACPGDCASHSLDICRCIRGNTASSLFGSPGRCGLDRCRRSRCGWLQRITFGRFCFWRPGRFDNLNNTGDLFTRNTLHGHRRSVKFLRLRGSSWFGNRRLRLGGRFIRLVRPSLFRWLNQAVPSDKPCSQT